MNPLAVSAGVVLAISMAANAALGWAYLGQRDTAVVATTHTQQADAVAKECSTGVGILGKQADKRHADAAPKVLAAQQAADAAGRLAIQIVTKPAAVPGDACASAEAALDDWWERKTKP